MTSIPLTLDPGYDREAWLLFAAYLEGVRAFMPVAEAIESALPPETFPITVHLTAEQIEARAADAIDRSTFHWPYSQACGIFNDACREWVANRDGAT